MEKHVSGLLIVIAVICLLVGGLVGYNMAPVKVVTETEYVNQNVSVEKLVEVQAPSQLDLAIAEFLEAVEDEEDEAGSYVDILDDMGYDFDEVSVRKVYDDYTIDREDDKTTVDFSIRLKFDEDDERSEQETYDVTVIYEDGEDTIVEVVEVD